MSMKSNILGLLSFSAMAMTMNDSFDSGNSGRYKPAIQKSELTPKQRKARKKAKHNRKLKH